MSTDKLIKKIDKITKKNNNVCAVIRKILKKGMSDKLAKEAANRDNYLGEEKDK